MISPFNDEQAQAIATRGVSILVSAPAGSGKTKILVSRIMSLLMEDGYHVDEFLVLTFTQAAAAEMKQRLLFAIEDELKKDLEPSVYAHLLKQKEKIPYAYITNFHGFCSQLLKKYGYLIQVEPGFDILSESALLKHQVLDACIEEWCREKEFTDFISLYFNDMRFDGFKSIVLELYEMMHSIDNVDRFVQYIKQQIYEDYMDSDQDLTTWQIFPEIKRQLKNAAISGYNNLIDLAKFAEEKGISDFFNRPEEQSKNNAALPVLFETMQDYFKERFQLLNQDYFAYDHFRQISLKNSDKAYTMKWDEDIKPYQKEFNSKKIGVTKPYLEKAKIYLPEDESAFKMILKESYYVIEMLLGKRGLVQRFKKAYQKEKKAQHILDFNDLEQYTIQLLQPQYHISELLYHKLREIMIDEYQDTNQIQETIIGLIKDYQTPSIVAFRVGDMKQSIYRFRQADPQLFKEKYDHYSLSLDEAKSTGELRIDLRFNYRSNKIVLDSVNYIFNQIMDNQVGGLEYLHDASSHLNYDYLRKERCLSLEQLPDIIRKTDERYQAETRFDSEVLLVDDTQTGVLKAAECEAHMVAQRIQKLISEETVDGYDGKQRNINYRDIVVLMRSTSLFLTFKKVFDQYQIPNHIVLSQGYLNAVEIISTITLLKAFINQYDDVSLLSLLRGNYLFSHFDEDLIMKVRLMNKEKTLMDNIKQYIESQMEGSQQLTDFKYQYDQLRERMLELKPSAFLREVLTVSGYRLFVSQLINGEQRVANLDLLVEEFAQFENKEDIFAIVKRYELMMEKQTASSPAQMISGSDNVVQFMTIHKSKGLEFPIVFVSNIDKGFNKQDSTKRILIDKQLGIAVKPRIKKSVEIHNGKWVDQIIEYENPYRRLLAARQTEEAINEEMRIFYVALTRASQKLIMSGVGRLETLIEWQQKILLNEDPDIYEGKENEHLLLYYNARKANSYLDWIGLSLMRHPQVIEQYSHLHLEDYPMIKTNFEKIAQLTSTHRYCFDNTKASKFTINFLSTAEIETMIETKMPKRIFKEENQQLHYLPLPAASTVTVTTSATKLQKEADDHDYGYTPIVNVHKEMSAADKGTLVHAFFEYLPMDGTPVSTMISQLYEKGLYDENEKAVLISYQDKIETFMQSDCFKRMKEAKQLYKEKAFSLLDNQTHQIVHGIFDVLCIEEDRITVIDYKTDHVKPDTKEHYLIENHRVQMEYYKLILKRMYPQCHIEAMVYYLEIGRYVIL